MGINFVVVYVKYVWSNKVSYKSMINLTQPQTSLKYLIANKKIMFLVFY